VVLQHPDFIEALKKRGITNMDQVMVDLWTVGHIDEEDAPARRLGRPFAFYKPFPGANGYGCPIEGVSPLIDLENMRVIRFVAMTWRE
jgi:primary-amine oxidase